MACPANTSGQWPTCTCIEQGMEYYQNSNICVEDGECLDGATAVDGTNLCACPAEDEVYDYESRKCVQKNDDCADGEEYVEYSNQCEPLCSGYAAAGGRNEYGACVPVDEYAACNTVVPGEALQECVCLENADWDPDTGHCVYSVEHDMAVRLHWLNFLTNSVYPFYNSQDGRFDVYSRYDDTVMVYSNDVVEPLVDAAYDAGIQMLNTGIVTPTRAEVRALIATAVYELAYLYVMWADAIMADDQYKSSHETELETMKNGAYADLTTIMTVPDGMDVPLKDSSAVMDVIEKLDEYIVTKIGGESLLDEHTYGNKYKHTFD